MHIEPTQYRPRHISVIGNSRTFVRHVSEPLKRFVDMLLALYQTPAIESLVTSPVFIQVTDSWQLYKRLNAKNAKCSQSVV